MQKQRSLFVSLLIVMLLTSSASLLSLAQSTDEPDANLRIAFVSNRRGNEDIYLMSQQGESDPLANITNNPARDWSPNWSPDGAQLVFNSDRDGRETLYVMNADGNNPRPLFPGETARDYDAVWSPDGEQILFTSDRGGAGRELYLLTLADGSVEQLTSDSTLKGDPAWSPDGTEFIYWQLENNGEIHLFRRPVIVEGNFTPQLLTNAGPANGAAYWSDGTVFFDSNREGNWYIYRMEPNGDSVRRISTGEVNSGRVTVAPSGSRLAFVSDRDDSDEIYLMQPDGSRLRRLTENGFSDHSPVWQPAVPENQLPPAPTPTPLASESESETTTDVASSALGPAIGQSVSGVIARPITEEQLLIDYAISAWHEAGWTGAGQRIGVIDTAFGGLSAFIERTGVVQIFRDDSISVYSDELNAHGTNVLEVIRTVAPNAELYACRYNGTLSGLRKCVDWLVDSQVRIINHSVGLPILPLNGQNEWARLVNDTFQRDILWVNSSGNFNQGYLTDNFEDRDGDGVHNFIFGSRARELVVPAIEGGYSGTVLLSWDETDITLYNPQTGLQERVDLDLEIIDAATGQIINRDSGHDNQNLDPNLPPAEIVRLSDIQVPFAIRVRNPGEYLDQRVPFAIFVEFAPLEYSDQTGSIVAPADARNSLTVGSVNGDRDLAVYSSRGLNIVDYSKPDISAPGELIMHDGSLFVGTSAASPVVAGIVALLLEQNPALRVDRIALELEETWIDRRDSRAFGAGIIQLGAPPSIRLETGVVNTPPKTVFPQPDEEFVDQGFVCNSPLPTRFEKDIPGYVNFDLQLNIRQAPTGDAPILDDLNFGTQFTVIDGPACVNGLYWWQVELDTGAEGWLNEAGDYYLIAPVSLERAQLPATYEVDTTCPNSLDSLLEVGDRGRILQSSLFFYRARGARREMQPLAAGTVVQILGGPSCEGQFGNTLRWYVRVVEGARQGYEGWVAEGDTDTRLIVPLD